jgi:hypothetical protein
MAGLTPFQFSSRMMQEQTSSFFGLSFGGAIENMLQSAFGWFEMWINPERVEINYSYIQKPQHTAGSIVTYHYRQDNPKMRVEGYCGWVMIQSEAEKTEGAVFTNPIKKVQNISFNKSGETRRTLASDNTDNSPRVFLKRLKAVSDQPMYFIDSSGVEHYNTKYIKIFTKQYPTGVICEGYYTSFNVPEAADDVQTIHYNFDFTIERITPITLIDRKLGMFGGATQAVGNLLRGGL